MTERLSAMMMLNRGIWLAISFSSFCAASSFGAQQDFGEGKTAVQLFAATCANCHKSPQSVAAAPGIFGLESFLREHYTSSPESAATLAAYLKRLERPSTGAARARAVKRAGQAKPPEATSSKPEEGELRPPADIPPPGLKLRQSN